MSIHTLNEQPPASQRHSPRFDKVSITPASDIENPLLQVMAQRLQQWMRAATVDSRHSTNSHITNPLSIVWLRQHLLGSELADASVLVAITNEAQPKMLLTRRASHLNSHAGEVSFAGGKYDQTDTNNVVTALREACEEVALPPNRVQIIGQLPVQVSKSGLRVRPIVALIDPGVTYVPELGEIARIFWADLTTLISQPTVEYQRVYQQAAQSITFVTPSWVIDGETVWGLTGRIIASLLDIGYERAIDWYYYPVPEV